MPAAAGAHARIEVGTQVHLNLSRIGALPATVEASDGDALVLALAVPEPRVSRLHGTEAAVETADPRGIQRLAGTLELTPGSAEIVRVRVTGEAQRIQRRQWVRVEAVTPVTVKALDEDLGGATTTVNVSGGGMLIADPWRLPLGLVVRLELEVEPGTSPVRALGRVVRAPAADRKGIRIDDMARPDEDRLIRFVRDRERAALRVSRGR